MAPLIFREQLFKQTEPLLILDLSKIEAGRLQLESTHFHLSAVLDNVGSILGAQARAKGLRIELDADAVSRWLRGDPTRLRQALLNYAGNALKFTDTGTISVSARLLEDHDGDLLVRFEVRDTGVGIAPDKLGRLFHAFEQADASTTREYGGSGLGLSITQRLAHLMGGEVWVESTPGAAAVSGSPHGCSADTASCPRKLGQSPRRLGRARMRQR